MSTLSGLVKTRVAVYVAQLAKNESFNFYLLPQWLFSHKSLRSEFHKSFKIIKPVLTTAYSLHFYLKG